MLINMKKDVMMMKILSVQRCVIFTTIVLKRYVSKCYFYYE